MRSGGSNSNFSPPKKTDQIGKFRAVYTYVFVLSGEWGPGPLGPFLGCATVIITKVFNVA